jgi:hypothetical protein
LDKDEETKQAIENIALPISQENVKALKNLMEAIDKWKEDASEEIDKETKSLFTNKKFLRYVLNLVNVLYESYRASEIAYFSLDFINRKVMMLEQVLTVMQNQLKEMPASEDVKKFREMSARMTEMDSLMTKIKQMTEQAEMEKANAFRKLDKARQQVMEDIV